MVSSTSRLKILARRFVARNLSWFVRFVVMMKLRSMNLTKANPVLILTVGKVGSSSVYHSLKEQLNVPVFHLHRFSAEGIKEAKTSHLQSHRRSIPLHLIISEELHKLISPRMMNYKIITLIREPVSRTVSAFFQNTEMYGEAVEGKNLEVDATKAMSVLEERFAGQPIDNEKAWFDMEIKGNFGIDVFAEPFDVKKGYQIYTQNGNQLLLLRMEDLNKVFPQASNEFFQVDGLELKNKNISENKIYSQTYNQIKNEFKLNPSRFESISQTKFYQKFYNDFTDTVKIKWCK